MKEIKNKKEMEIVFLLDRSGSMGGLEEDTIGGYNSFINSHKKTNAKLTTILFDNQIEVIHDREDISKIKKLTSKEYYVRGCTALLDAIGYGITRITDKNKKVIFVITTDGLENASKEYNKKTIKNMIEERTNWEFMYLGANIDSYSEADSIGIKKERVSNYSASKKGTKNMFGALSRAVSCFECEEALPADWNKGLED